MIDELARLLALLEAAAGKYGVVLPHPFAPRT
jgi:hypothetical protein